MKNRITKEMLDEADMPDTPSARKVLAKMLEEDDDIQDYKKPWVGLTDEELMGCTEFKHFTYDSPYIDKNGAKHVGHSEVSLRKTYEHINNKLKEKNT